MGFIGNHRKAFALGGCQFVDGFQREREGLDRADHHLLVATESVSQLLAFASATAADGGDNSFPALEGFQGFLELGVDHVAIAHHNHRIEDLLVLLVVEL